MNRSTLLPTILLLALPAMSTPAEPAEPGMAAAAAPQTMYPGDLFHYT